MRLVGTALPPSQPRAAHEMNNLLAGQATFRVSSLRRIAMLIGVIGLVFLVAEGATVVHVERGETAGITGEGP